VSDAPRTYINTGQAAAIGVAAMVGAGIFSLLGTAGEVAGSAVWLSFVLAGVIAAFQGYSFGKRGARYPSAAGLLEYVTASFGSAHITAVMAWLVYAVNTIITAMVAVSFGSYASSAFAGDDPLAAKAFAVVVVSVMTALNIAGSTIVARVQSLVVFIVVGILALFAIVTILNGDRSMLNPSTYPPARTIVSSVARTFFAFRGFGVVTFTAKDLKDPARQLPRAIIIAIAVATAIYVAVSIGVFSTLTVDEVLAAGPTAIAVAAEPVLGTAGLVLIQVTALFATAGSTNSGLYPAIGLSDYLAAQRLWPPVMASRVFGRVPMGLLAGAVATIVLALFLDLNAIASIGSAVALFVFTIVTAGHLRVRGETGAQPIMLVLALVTSAIALIAFMFTTLINEPRSIVVLILIFVLSVVLDLIWSRMRDSRPDPDATPGPSPSTAA
jgi:amino acid transporter